MEFFYYLLLLCILVVHTTITSDYHVIPDNFNRTTPLNNAYTLQHYLSYISKDITDHSRLFFQPGKYYLKTDFAISNVLDFKLSSENSTLICNGHERINIVNVTNFTMENI